MNLCPSEGTYCNLSHNHETCLYHSTEARCPHRLRAYFKRREVNESD